MSDNTILKKAINERNQILEAAEKNAKNKLAKDMAEKFNEILTEEINKLKNKESLKESTMKDNNKDGKIPEIKNSDKKKEPVKVNEDIDLSQVSLEEVENEFDNASGDDEFEIQNDFIDLEELEKELENLEQVDATNPENMEQEVDANTTPDEVVSQETQPEMPVEESTDDPYYTRMKKLEEEISNLVKEMEQTKAMNEYDSQFNEKMQDIYGESFKETLGEKYNELKEMFINKKNGAEDKPVEINETEDVIAEIPNEDEPEIDESHGVGLSQQKGVSGNQLPRPEYADYKKFKLRYAVQKENWERKLKHYINENKKITTVLNKQKAENKKTNALLKEYSEVVKKYRSQLNEMAIFNTNLSYANNLLLNEELSLTESDKINIINKFKKVNNINESEKLYNSLLVELKTSKPSINESIENKLTNTNSIQNSNKQILDESIKEKTGFSSNNHVDRIKRTISYIENK